MKSDREPRISRKIKYLTSSWGIFIANLLSEFLAKNGNNTSITGLSNWVDETRRNISSQLNIDLPFPILKTCEYFYDEGSKYSKKIKIIEFFSGGGLWLGFGLMFGGYLLVGFIIASICLICYCLCVFRKRI